LARIVQLLQTGCALALSVLTDVLSHALRLEASTAVIELSR